MKSWIKTPETRQQINPIHSQRTSFSMPPSPATRMLRRLMTVVRNAFSFIPQSVVDMGERSFALGEKS
jgi:hypothetical protein